MYVVGALLFFDGEHRSRNHSDILPDLSHDTPLRKESILRTTQAYNNGNQGMLHSGCEPMWKNQKMAQRRTSQEAGRKNITGQRSGSNSSIRKLLLLIFKCGVY